MVPLVLTAPPPWPSLGGAALHEKAPQHTCCRAEASHGSVAAPHVTEAGGVSKNPRHPAGSSSTYVHGPHDIYCPNTEWAARHRHAGVPAAKRHRWRPVAPPPGAGDASSPPGCCGCPAPDSAAEELEVDQVLLPAVLLPHSHPQNTNWMSWTRLSGC